MNRYKHITFNPLMEPIDAVINRLGGQPIWSFSHIVCVNEYKTVAVFEAWDGNADEEKEFGRIPVSPLGTTLTNQAGLLPPSNKGGD